MANTQKRMFPKQCTCVVCGGVFQWGDEKLMTVNHSIYYKAAPVRPVNPGEGVRVCGECLAKVLTAPLSALGRKFLSSFVEALTSNYKKVTTAPEKPLGPVADGFAPEVFS